jgi:hypothetical protein
VKTTFVISDEVMARLREEAARRKTTISELVEAALRLLLEQTRRPPVDLPPLPTFNGGVPLVDISNREALSQALDEDDQRLYGPRTEDR